MRRMRVYDLANQKDKSAAKAFLDLFDDVDPDVQEAAIARIGDLDDPIAIPHLAQIMRTSGAAHQEAAMISLQELSYSHRDNNLLIETTLDALSSGNSEIRHRAAQILGHINTYDVGTGVYTPDPRVVEPLARALKDPDHRVVGAAATSLGSQNLTQESASIFDSLMKCQAAWKSIRAAGYKDNPSDENSAKERIEEYFALKQAGACCLDALVRMDAKQFGPRLASMSPEVLVIIDGPTRWQRSLTRALDVLVTDKEPELVKQIEYMKAAIAQEGLRNTTK